MKCSINAIIPIFQSSKPLATITSSSKTVFCWTEDDEFVKSFSSYSIEAQIKTISNWNIFHNIVWQCYSPEKKRKKETTLQRQVVSNWPNIIVLVESAMKQQEIVQQRDSERKKQCHVDYVDKVRATILSASKRINC